MDSKKIYLILQHWFPKLNQYDLPPRAMRGSYDVLLRWLQPDAEALAATHFLMNIQSTQDQKYGLFDSALLRDNPSELAQTLSNIQVKIVGIAQYYQQHQAQMGRHCCMQGQIYQAILAEIYLLLQRLNYELLLISAEQYHWLAVPDNQDLIDSFCYCFTRLFAAEGYSIEHYQANSHLWDL